MRLATLCLLLVSVLKIPCQAGQPNEAAQIAATMEAVFECVLDRHIEPPTRQQMVLALVRQLHRDDPPADLAELSRTVSELGSKDALYQFMREEIERHPTTLWFDPEHPKRMNFDWLSTTIPGGVELDDPKNVDVEQQLAANRYVGIGVQLSKDAEGYVFSLVMENGSAAKGGIVSGDHLMKINDRAIDGDMEHVVDQLRGPEGSTFRVTVQTGQDSPRDIELRRQVVVMKTVKLEPLQPQDTTAVITVGNIKASSVHELQTLIEQLPDSVNEVQLKIEFDGNFHYFCLFADALLDHGQLGRMITREGRRLVTTSDGNVLAGRKLKIELTDRAEQQQLLSFLALRVNRLVMNEQRTLARSVYLLEPLPIMDGQAVLSVATRRFERE